MSNTYEFICLAGKVIHKSGVFSIWKPYIYFLLVSFGTPFAKMKDYKKIVNSLTTIYASACKGRASLSIGVILKMLKDKKQIVLCVLMLMHASAFPPDTLSCLNEVHVLQ